jgi:hypothetical protein
MRTFKPLLAFLILGVPLGATDVPTVTSVTPSPIVMSGKAQPLKVTGSGFARGLTVEVTLQGSTETYKGATLQDSSGTVFDIAVVLAQPGEATLVVRNTDGGVSQPFPLTILAGAPPEPAQKPGPVPTIDRAVPEQATRSTVPQHVTLMGSNFAPGATVTVTSPTGVVTLIPTSSLESVTPTAIRFKVALDVSGEYTFAVTNPPKQTSDTVTIVVT